MKNTKRVRIKFDFFDRAGISKYLEEQAQQGWMLKKIGRLFWTFEKIEPAPLHFAVTYFPKASEYDPAPSEEQAFFYEMCEHTGWKLVTTSAQMQIFCNEAENPVPIETDPCVDVENIHKSINKVYRPLNVALAVLCAIQIKNYITRVTSDPMTTLSNNASLVTLLGFALLLIFSMHEIIRYGVWYKKAKKAAEKEGILLNPGTKKIFGNIIFTIFFLAFFYLLISSDHRMTVIYVVTALGFTAIRWFVRLLSKWMKHKKVSAAENGLLSFVLLAILIGSYTYLTTTDRINLLPEEAEDKLSVYSGDTFALENGELPLTTEDLIEGDFDNYTSTLSVYESIFSAQLTGTHYPEDNGPNIPNINYTVTKIKMPQLHDWYLEKTLDQTFKVHHRVTFSFHLEYIPIYSEPWGAEHVYRRYSDGHPLDTYLIDLGDRIITISPDWELTTEQKQTIVSVLGSI